MICLLKQPACFTPISCKLLIRIGIRLRYRPWRVGSHAQRPTGNRDPGRSRAGLPATLATALASGWYWVKHKRTSVHPIGALFPYSFHLVRPHRVTLWARRTDWHDGCSGTRWAFPLMAPWLRTGRFSPCSPVTARVAFIFDDDKVEPYGPAGSYRLTFERFRFILPRKRFLVGTVSVSEPHSTIYIYWIRLPPYHYPLLWTM
jgi:hypothetical protein